MMQIAANALVTANTILLVAVGFALIFGIVRFFHFAHGIVFTAGAYLAFVFHSWAGLPLIAAVIMAVVGAAVIGCAIEIAVYRPLRRKAASPLILLLASLGVYVVLQNLISIVCGDDTKQLRSSEIPEAINILGARITWVQSAMIAVTAVLVATLALLVRKTKLGQAMRAVADDPQLASVSGIESDRVVVWTLAISSALAAVAGILVALDVDMTPTMGMNPLMLGVVAVIVGGVRGIPGIVLAALLLACAQQATVWVFGSAWQDAVAFLVLLVFLLVRPQGVLGGGAQKASG
jgi:branched-chain amino acid transport system permease protein